MSSVVEWRNTNLMIDWLIDWTQILDHPHRPLPSLGDFLQI